MGYEDVLAGIDPEVIDATVTDDGIEFTWHNPDGSTVVQLRPDDPGRGPKYVWPKGTRLPLGVPLGMAERVMDPTCPLIVVEGTRQHLAAASAALKASADKPRYAVVGISGCWGWSQDSAPIPHLHDVPLEGRQVIVAFDADIATNRDVWSAADRFREFLRVEVGAQDVSFILLSGSKDGMDDILRRAKDPVGTFLRIIGQAQGNLPRKPALSRNSPLFAGDQFLVMSAYEELLARHPMAATKENSIAVYDGGVYWNGESKMFNASVVELLGENFREAHLSNVHELAVSILKTTGVVIEEPARERLVNVRNGLVDPVTLQLRPHDPGFRTLFQFAVEWDPEATCPTYERWIEQVMPGRVLELEDAIAPMLDPTVTPTKAPFLHGPSRSGKSTFGRLLKAVVGNDCTSAVTLHQLSDDRFATANLYGKILNLAMDLSSKDVRDLSTFKMITGDDLVSANRKYGHQFRFTNRALIVFSANEVPSVSESSKAWISRIAPFEFPNSFIGAEDPSIEEAMMRELPGIFRRWVLALQAHLERGGYLPADVAASQEFLRRSNKPAEFLHETTVPTINPEGTDRALIYAKYKTWAEVNGGHPMGRNKFFDNLRSLGVDEFRVMGEPRKFAVRFKAEGEDDGPENGPDTTSARDADAGEPRTFEAEKVANGRDLSPETGSHTTFPPNTSSALSPIGSLPILSEHEIPLAVLVKSGMGSKSGMSPLVFDLETAGAELLHRAGPFVRIIGTPHGVGTDPRRVLDHPGPLVAHFGFTFDFLAMARHHGLDMLGRELIDTAVLDLLDDPIPAGMKSGQTRKCLALDEVAARRTGVTKTDDIKRLAKHHGGFDKIPTDDPEYLAYCAGDVAATEAILASLPEMNEYARREMAVMTRLSASISLQGFRLDTELLRSRYDQGQEVLEEGKAKLVDSYGLPTVKKDGKPAKSPQATAEGKQAIDQAFLDLGVELPRTATGAPMLDKATMQAVIDQGEQDQRILAEVVQSLNGVRTVYGTLLDHAVDGRVHPEVFPLQASGRMSVTAPGLTVLGKRGGRVIERAVLLPDEGHVLIACDLNQIDARAIAAHCQDRGYLRLFDPGINPATGTVWDSHAEIAQLVWGDRSRREQAKVIGHGWNYGMGIQRIARETGVPLEQAREFDAAMRENFPRLVAWKQEMAEIGAGGALLDNGFGRRMRPTPERAHTQAPALMGQGTARDLMMEGILRMPMEMVPMLRAIVHDEVILSVPEDIVADVEQELLKALQFEWAPPGASRSIQVTAGLAKRGDSWSACYRKGE